jgi:hypothetical protein
MNRVKLIRFVDLALIVQFVLVGFSGFIMYFNHEATNPLLSSIHDKSGILMLVLFAAHIILDWRLILFTVRKFYRRGKKVKEGEVIEANYIPIE